jgi:8-oxo-dGTP diphosphatase
MNKSITKYVLGFLFKADDSSVVLIRKTKPKWQAGLLNGIGGKMEDGENPAQAMIREFAEETGVDTSDIGWTQFCEISGEDFVVYCFKTSSDDLWKNVEDKIPAHSSEPDKIIEYIFVMHPLQLKPNDCVSNLLWLIAMAMDKNYGRKFYANVRYDPPYNMSRWYD